MNIKIVFKVTVPLLLLLLLLVLVLARPFYQGGGGKVPMPLPDFPIPLAFTGDSRGLKATEIVSTLDAPITKGKNAIWCASFLSAWKAMEQDFVREAILLDSPPKTAGLLNDAVDPRPFIPASAMYTAIGWSQSGIVEHIRSDLRRRFPDKEPPTFPGITPDSFVAFAYLEANVTFSLPFNQNKEPFPFMDGSGNKTQVTSFGLPLEDVNTYSKLRAQVHILFLSDKWTWTNETTGMTYEEFVIDLCSNSSPSQIIVAKIAPQPTLAAALAQVQKDIATADRSDYISIHDSLLVPDFHWFVSHRFSELEGRGFGNQKLKGQRLDVARQDILFRLDKNGAELKAEARMNMTSQPKALYLDRPFLIYMKTRGAQTPFFVMWIDNAELMNPWNPTSAQTVISHKGQTVLLHN